MGEIKAKKTPLYDLHKSAGAKMVDFGGWLMPVSYSSVLAEHKTVRESVGIFDVSHMGEVIVSGKEAKNFLQSLTINDINRLSPGHGQYSAMLTPDGGMIDDVILYQLETERFLICVNASNTDKDFAWIEEQAKHFGKGVQVANESLDWGQIAIQGPNSLAAVQRLLGQSQEWLNQLDYMQIKPVDVYGQQGLLARTGYTGEWGYELYLPTAVLAKVWLSLLEMKDPLGLQPIGLGARDTLRLEACYLLYGNDMNGTVSPLEAGIAWATKLDKGDFIGRNALAQQKSTGLTRLLVAFKMEGSAIPRHGMECYLNSVKIGEVTSGSVLPTVGGAGGLALLDPRKVKVGDTFEVDVRGKRNLARIVKKPLYNAKVRA